MYHVAHHVDDGIEQEYWFVQDDSTPGQDGEGEAFETEEECRAEVDRLNRQEGHYR